MIYEILRCHDDIRNTTLVDESCDPNAEECETVDPQCASEEEIDEWIERKKTNFRIVNNKIHFGSDAVRQNEQFT